MFRPTSLRAPLLLALFLFSCQKQSPTPPAEETSAPEGAASAKLPDTSIAHVPVGKFRAGSLPGEADRRPEFETASHEIELGPFRIDAHPYPGEPGAPPRTGVSKSDAEALCAARQGRLCTEVEWERACKGPLSTNYPSGDGSCSADSACESGFEVFSLGRLPEWTSSQFGPGVPWENKGVIRGAPREAKGQSQRCAHRLPESEVPSSSIGFRCCYGAPNAKLFSEPELGPAYEETSLSIEELTALLKSDPRTETWAEKLTFFRDPDGARTVFDRGPKESMGFTLTTKPLLWQPERGVRILVVSARSGEKTSFVVAYYVTESQKLLAGSFLMKNEVGPIALAYAPSIRPRVHFSNCWGCPGETGKILFRAPEELVLLQP